MTNRGGRGSDRHRDPESRGEDKAWRGRGQKVSEAGEGAKGVGPQEGRGTSWPRVWGPWEPWQLDAGKNRAGQCIGCRQRAEGVDNLDEVQGPMCTGAPHCP